MKAFVEGVVSGLRVDFTSFPRTERSRRLGFAAAKKYMVNGQVGNTYLAGLGETAVDASLMGGLGALADLALTDGRNFQVGLGVGLLAGGTLDFLITNVLTLAAYAKKNK